MVFLKFRQLSIGFQTNSRSFSSEKKSINYCESRSRQPATRRTNLQSLGNEAQLFELRNRQMQIELIKGEVASRSQKWRTLGVQLSLPYWDEGPSLLDKLFKLRDRQIQTVIYELIFLKQIAYQLVFDALQESRLELGLFDDRGSWMKDPLSMVTACLWEHWQQVGQQTLEPFLSLSKS